MSDPDLRDLIAGAGLAAGLLALPWQWLSARASGPGRLPSRIPFWFGAVAWVLFGLLSRERTAVLGVELPLGWILPGAGLVAMAILRWSRVDLPGLLEAEVAVEPALGEAGDAGMEPLDAEDTRLFHRLLSLRDKRVEELMVPLERAEYIRAGEGWEQMLARLGRSPALRLPVVDEARGRVLGIIDGRDLMAWLPAAAGAHGQGEGFSLKASLKPLPAVQPHQRTGEVLGILKNSGAGMAAVTSAAGSPVGIISWDQIFRALIGRSPAEGGR